MAVRVKALRLSFSAHWELADTVGCYYPRFADQLEAARLVDFRDLTHFRAARDHGNWARHATPPGALRQPAMPIGRHAVDMEAHFWAGAHRQALASTLL